MASVCNAGPWQLQGALPACVGVAAICIYNHFDVSATFMQLSCDIHATVVQLLPCCRSWVLLAVHDAADMRAVSTCNILQHFCEHAVCCSALLPQLGQSRWLYCMLWMAKHGNGLVPPRNIIVAAKRLRVT